MQLIDLNNGIGCHIDTYPDGEKHLVLDEIDRKEAVVVKCSITSGNDLFVLMQLGDILTRQGVELNQLIIGYLMSARVDRVFDFNRPFSLKIVADVINSLNASQVIIFDVHSRAAMRLIKNAISPLCSMVEFMHHFKEVGGVVAVMPDEGAAIRYQQMPSQVQRLTCKKHRNPETGMIESVDFCEAIDPTTYKGKNLFVLDDLCDGGGTFIAIAPALRNLQPNSLNLIVTHAIQQSGIERVAQVYDKVFISDSYRNWHEVELPENVVIFSTGLYEIPEKSTIAP